MAYDAKKIYYRFDDHLSRLVLDYEASRQISPESENLYHGMPTDPYDEGHHPNNHNRHHNHPLHSHSHNP